MAVPVANQAARTKRPIKTALHQAVLDCRIHQVRLLVNKHGGNVDSKDVFGRTPLMLACLIDNQEDGFRMSKIFLKAGAYVNIRDNMQRTALHYACMKGKTRMVQRLVREEAVSINAPDNDGNTPLIHAALSGTPELVRVVVEIINKFGLSVDERNCLGYTALLLACKYGHYVSALTLFQIGRGQPTLRDNEFFLNAMEWVTRSADLHAAFASTQKSRFEIPRFTRERSKYRGDRVPSSHACHHVKAPSHPLGESLDSALRLPAVFSYVPVENANETYIDGIGARLLLLKEMDEAFRNPKNKPKARLTMPSFSRVSHSTRSERSRYVTTAKILALTSRSHTAMVPDMRTLFTLYSDQHQEKVDRGVVMSAPAGALRSQNASGKLPGIQVHFDIATPSTAGTMEA